MDWLADLAVALWPLAALLIAALLRGALLGLVHYLEGRLGFDVDQRSEERLLRLANRAIDWVSHKLPRANDDAEKQRAKLQAAVDFMRAELERVGAASRLQEWSDERLARLIEGVIAERKRARGELTRLPDGQDAAERKAA